MLLPHSNMAGLYNEAMTIATAHDHTLEQTTLYQSPISWQCCSGADKVPVPQLSSLEPNCLQANLEAVTRMLTGASILLGFWSPTLQDILKVPCLSTE